MQETTRELLGRHILERQALMARHILEAEIQCRQHRLEREMKEVQNGRINQANRAGGTGKGPPPVPVIPPGMDGG